jgi:hypothetical protein
MPPRIACNLWHWIEAHQRDVEPPVGHQVIWEDSQCTAIIACRPHA